MKTVYNRGFWDGYYLGQTLGEWTGQHGSLATRRKEYVGKVTNYFRKLMVAEIRMESGSLEPGDSIYIQGPTTGSIEMMIPEIRVDLKTVKKTVKGDQCSIPVDTFLRRADKIYKISIMIKLKFNLHTHTRFSDGSSDPEDYIKEAIHQGFDTLGFSDHSPVPFENNFAIRQEELENYIQTILKLKNDYASRNA